MCSVKNGFVCVLMAAAAIMISSGVTYFALSRQNHPNRITIDSFDAKDAPKHIEFGAKNLNQLFVSSSSRGALPFGRSLELKLKLMPDSYNFIASGQGLADKSFDWEKRPADIKWDSVIGLSYKVYISAVKGAPTPVNLVRLATDLIDGDGEILRKITLVHTGDWVDVNVYFQDVVSRGDYQRDWKSVKRIRNGEIEVPLNKVDNGLRSYQVEVLGLMADPVVDIRKNEVEVDLNVDDVSLITK